MRMRTSSEFRCSNMSTLIEKVCSFSGNTFHPRYVIMFIQKFKNNWWKKNIVGPRNFVLRKPFFFYPRISCSETRFLSKEIFNRIIFMRYNQNLFPKTQFSSAVTIISFSSKFRSSVFCLYIRTQKKKLFAPRKFTLQSRIFFFKNNMYCIAWCCTCKVNENFKIKFIIIR